MKSRTGSRVASVHDPPARGLYQFSVPLLPKPRGLLWRVSPRSWSLVATGGSPPARCVTSSSATVSGLTLTSAVPLIPSAIHSRLGLPASRLSRSCRSRWVTSGSAPPRSTPTPPLTSWWPGSSAWPTVSRYCRPAGRFVPGLARLLSLEKKLGGQTANVKTEVRETGKLLKSNTPGT